MRAVRGLVLVGGLIVGLAGQASAQFSLNIGNPYTGQGISIGSPGLGGYGYNYGGAGYGYGYGASNYGPGYGVNNYGPNYALNNFGPSYGYSSGYSSYRGIGPGLGYTNNYQSYSSTGYLSGPGAIGYTSGYAGINTYGAAYGRPVYNNYGYAPFRGVARVNPFRW